MTVSSSGEALVNSGWELGPLHAKVSRRLDEWTKVEFGRRFWLKDPSVWPQAAPRDVGERLGWLTLPHEMLDRVDALRKFADETRLEGIRHIVLLGMGGSSLAPEVYQETLGNARGFPALIVLDSTHPASVRSVRKRIDPHHTVFLVSSKSGTTLEPLAFFHYFWSELQAAKVPPGPHFVAITDPGTPLEKLALEHGFRRVFSAKPDVGGRYAALTDFGLVPAALIGADLLGILGEARRMQNACASGAKVSENPGLQLGAVLGELALAGRDKVTFLVPDSWKAFPSWAEQLIAESTGKLGKGIVPVAEEREAPPKSYGNDRLFVFLRSRSGDGANLDDRVAALEGAGHPVVRIDLDDPIELGQEFFRWEFAVAAAGSILGIDPFDQPDVELAKELARRAIGKKGAAARPGPDDLAIKSPSTVKTALRHWMGFAQPGSYVAIQAYLTPSSEIARLLEKLRDVLLGRLHVATTLGFGPRFLHSTGQLHKGGPPTGLFLQLVDTPKTDLSVPDADYTFGDVIRAQALGDFQALKQRGRHVLRIRLGGDVVAGLRRILEALHG